MGICPVGFCTVGLCLGFELWYAYCPFYYSIFNENNGMEMEYKLGLILGVLI